MSKYLYNFEDKTLQEIISEAQEKCIDAGWKCRRSAEVIAPVEGAVYPHIELTDGDNVEGYLQVLDLRELDVKANVNSAVLIHTIPAEIKPPLFIMMNENGFLTFVNGEYVGTLVNPISVETFRKLKKVIKRER